MVLKPKFEAMGSNLLQVSHPFPGSMVNTKCLFVGSIFVYFYKNYYYCYMFIVHIKSHKTCKIEASF